MKLLLPVARSCRVSFLLVFHRAWPDLQRMKLLLPVARSCRVSFFLVFHRAWPDLQRMKLLLPVATSCRVSFLLAIFSRRRQTGEREAVIGMTPLAPLWLHRHSHRQSSEDRRSKIPSEQGK